MEQTSPPVSSAHVATKIEVDPASTASAHAATEIEVDPAPSGSYMASHHASPVDEGEHLYQFVINMRHNDHALVSLMGFNGLASTQTALPAMV
jgi:hypothetical protein